MNSLFCIDRGDCFRRWRYVRWNLALLPRHIVRWCGQMRIAVAAATVPATLNPVMLHQRLPSRHRVDNEQQYHHHGRGYYGSPLPTPLVQVQSAAVAVASGGGHGRSDGHGLHDERRRDEGVVTSAPGRQWAHNAWEELAVCFSVGSTISTSTLATASSYVARVAGVSNCRGATTK